MRQRQGLPRDDNGRYVCHQIGASLCAPVEEIGKLKKHNITLVGRINPTKSKITVKRRPAKCAGLKRGNIIKHIKKCAKT